MYGIKKKILNNIRGKRKKEEEERFVDNLSPLSCWFWVQFTVVEELAFAS